MYAKHYENPTMLSRVTAKNVGDVFFRHTVCAIFLRENTEIVRQVKDHR